MLKIIEDYYNLKHKYTNIAFLNKCKRNAKVLAIFLTILDIILTHYTDGQSVYQYSLYLSHIKQLLLNSITIS